MSFYYYGQNNSGGKFHLSDVVCVHMFIEAASREEADAKAEQLGIYFDGVDKDIDCSCCGDRWMRGEELQFPIFWSRGVTLQNVDEYAQQLIDSYGNTARIFYANGSMVEVS